ncbi:GNAT family N-acetyltransferase [Humisphaera borealis]|uniref:GNAT family N-acetyltransferase n=1 Tax=Humisphaera borealis TaxID=2807512 RepID=A0A7M2WZJ8_9BACT|nr:GNAT family N-acetyltransferase [Humisphaera borealis]QOV90906.1 GNAT family N-acetyltransferase [Humisphaera borealis]
MSRRSLTILPATLGDLPYIVALAKRETDTIGFLPRAAYAEYITASPARKGVLLARLNGDPCGFMVWRIAADNTPAPASAKIIQTCIQYDARRRSRGVALVGELLYRVGLLGVERVSLWCADDLEANAFWESCGFQFRGQRDGGTRRGRNHNLWVLDCRLPGPNRAGGVAGFPLTSRKPTPSAEVLADGNSRGRQVLADGNSRRELAYALQSPDLSIDTKCEMLAAIAAADIAAAERSLAQAHPSAPRTHRRRP